MHEKLKPCPFCGGDPYLFKDNFGYFGVLCDGCNLYFGIEVENNVPLYNGWRARLVTEKAAVRAWNCRNRETEEENEQ